MNYKEEQLRPDFEAFVLKEARSVETEILLRRDQNGRYHMIALELAWRSFLEGTKKGPQHSDWLEDNGLAGEKILELIVEIAPRHEGNDPETGRPEFSPLGLAYDVVRAVFGYPFHNYEGKQITYKDLTCEDIQ